MLCSTRAPHPTPAPIPDRPFLPPSAPPSSATAACWSRRARGPAFGIWTLPGGVVEPGETLIEALQWREIGEETAMTVEPVALAGHREVLVRDDFRRVSRHFVIPVLCRTLDFGRAEAERGTGRGALAQARGMAPLKTTEGLAEIVAAAFERMAAAG